MKKRLTLEDMPSHNPTPDELYNELMQSEGWYYKTDKEFYLQRDRALVAVLYLSALRISEAIRITAMQFSEPISDERGKYIMLKDVLLSKRRGDKREFNNFELPLENERAKFTQLIINYLVTLKPEDRLFPWSLRKTKTPSGFYTNIEGKKVQRWQHHLIGCVRAWQIVKALLPNITEHWLRQYGEDFFYEKVSGKDPFAVSSKFKVDIRTVAKWYEKRRHLTYPVR